MQLPGHWGNFFPIKLRFSVAAFFFKNIFTNEEKKNILDSKQTKKQSKQKKMYFQNYSQGALHLLK